MGRRPIGKRAMSDAQRQRRRRARLVAEAQARWDAEEQRREEQDRKRRARKRKRAEKREREREQAMTPAERERRRQQEAEAENKRAEAAERFWDEQRRRWDEILGMMGDHEQTEAEEQFRSRLAKICAMLGSDKPGERDNAARMADEMVRKSRHPWEYWLGIAVT